MFATPPSELATHFLDAASVSERLALQADAWWQCASCAHSHVTRVLLLHSWARLAYVGETPPRRGLDAVCRWRRGARLIIFLGIAHGCSFRLPVVTRRCSCARVVRWCHEVNPWGALLRKLLHAAGDHVGMTPGNRWWPSEVFANS